MEQTIRNSVRHLKEALDRLERAACDEISAAGNDEKLKTFWKYARPIMIISNTLDEAGMMT